MSKQLRQVIMRPYVDQSIVFTLTTWDANRRDDMGKNVLRYEFRQGEQVLFQGEDFSCSPMNAVGSDESLRDLLGFLVLRPGDTDEEYFAGYTPEQLDFANEHGEILSCYAHEDNPDEWDSEEV